MVWYSIPGSCISAYPQLTQTHTYTHTPVGGGTMLVQTPEPPAQLVPVSAQVAV